VSFRVYFFDKNQKIRRIPIKTYEALKEGKESIPEYANQEIRVVELLLEMKDRKPIQILRSWGVKWNFNKDGSIKGSYSKRISVEAQRYIFFDSEDVKFTEGNVIDAKQKFSNMHYDNRYKWEPSSIDIDRISKLIWKPKKKKKQNSSKVIKFPTKR